MSKITYKDAGVNVESGYEAVRLMKEHVKKTFNDNVLTELGNFGGLYQLDEENVLVAGTDGVGTKLKIAFEMDQHDTVGIDLVAMCANDVVCHGAKPILFLDYIATGAVSPEKVANIVSGIANGCQQAGAALIGGETAEMPGFYGEGEYDLAGFCVGVVKKKDIITGAAIQEGDILIGLKSSGIHSNGYSLVRKLFSITKEGLAERLADSTVGQTLLTPTKIYVKTILRLVEKFSIHGIAHITGGGFIENIPRMIPKGLAAEIKLDSFEKPAVFEELVKRAGLAKEEAYNTFNMGIGMVLAVDPAQAEDVSNEINQNTDDTAYQIGRIVTGEEGVILCD